MTIAKDDLRKLADKALDAFWHVIAKHYPQATSGDLSPWCAISLQDAAEDAIEEWIDNNVPATNK
jgi:hypothetical protein